MTAGLSKSPDSRSQVNPRWVVATLKERGIPAPALPALVSGIALLSTDQSERMRAAIQRLNAGTDEPEDMAFVADLTGGMRLDPSPNVQQPEGVSVPPASLDEVDHSSKLKTPSPELGSSRPVVDPTKRFEKSHHVYSSKGGVCFEPTHVVPDAFGQAGEGYYTLQIEAASALSKKRYDWERKIIFRLTQRELPLFAASLMGWCPALDFGNHGAANDKFLEVRDQAADGRIYLKVRQGKRVIGIPIGGEELFTVTTMALTVLGRNTPGLDSQSVLHLVKRCGQMYARSTGSTGSE